MAMTKALKGITVQIGAETTGLSNALKGVNDESYKISKELKEVNNLLKFNPKNTEALTQKQELLGNEISTTKEKLDKLKASQDDVVEAFKNGEIAEEDYRSFKRELVKTESQLKNYKKQLKDTNDQKNKFKTGLKNATTEMGKFGKKAGGIAKKGIKTLAVGVAGIATAMVALTESTREYRDDLSKLEQNARNSGNDFTFMKDQLSYLNAVTGETDSSIEALSNLMAVGFDDAEMVDVVDALAGAVIKFPDTLKIEGLADGLQETLATGQAIGPFAELIERMGGNVEEFNTQLAGATTEAEKQQVAMKWLAESGLAEVNEQYKQNNEDAIRAKEAQFAMNDALAVLAETVEPVITKFKEGLVPIIQTLTNWVQDNMPQFQDIMDKAFTKASEVIEILWKWVEDNLWPILQDMFAWVSDNWPMLQSTFETVFGVITDVAKMAWDIFENFLLPIFVEIFEWTEENWPAIEAIISGVFDGIKLIWDTILQPVLDALLGLFGDIYDYVDENFPGLQETIENVFGGIGKAVQAVVGFFSDLYDGIKDALDAWNDWVDRPPDSRDATAGGGSSGGGGGGWSSKPIPHAMGLDYVPYDGYLAELHRGERVLTAQEASSMNDIGGQVVRALEEAGLTKPANIYLDGKRVGNGLIRVVDRGLDRESSEYNIGKGALEW